MAGMAPGTAKVADDGECVVVATGAVLPDGCDCVIPVERTRREGDRITLEAGYRPDRGQFIHARGSDCVGGEAVLAPGTRLGPAQMMQLATHGYGQVEVAATPSIAFVLTGDELLAPDAPLRPGSIRRSNDTAIGTALARHGFDDLEVRHVADDPATAARLLGELLETRHVLILSGGVSMGQRDFVPGVLESLGVKRVFHRIAQRPGKPMWFGMGTRHQAVFALPGNPVSSLVCAVRYVRPALLEAQGLAPTSWPHACLAQPLAPHPELTRFVPVRVAYAADGLTQVEPVATNTSGDLTALAATDGFVELAPGTADAPAGASLPLYGW
jgi:molybdopterin molybdotransferase